MFAQKFIEQLREGNTTEAINTLKEALKEGSNSKIDETRVEVLQSYGFSVNENFGKDDDDEEEEDGEEEESDDDDEEEEEKKKDDE